MKRTAFGIGMVLSVLFSAFSFQLSAYADEARVVTSSELIEKALELDGQAVIYRGELIAGVLNRGDHSWANLNDGINAIGVWCPAELLSVIEFAGDYKYTGDTVEVQGVFNRACPLHGGELDIHASGVSIVEKGSSRDNGIDKVRANLSVIVFSVLMLLMVIFRNRL